MDKMKVTYETMLSLTAEMIWDNAIRKYRTERIYEEIDKALAAGDETTFRSLTEELKTLQ
ncbi:IDEAL domain-containing protein [Paenibacillus thiaminolyticus]|uniref:IDEAL domain-containing protein n=1 Tax=Paenibacillus thiaminolyticus TaxID=49283 RepID=UPI00116391A2|nr:IDEAL domain-containing protein [Paenibacillus thiaminolyticus]MDG0875310.1 IDEAL domain-containing protein [Paenibacillus thiaminolyticus]NGP56909.1 IDEAL domain-containing protein [Paenibacillus thiaminolyticus]WCR27887.1 IDEAL domain-containing protein [Paenibacillus thiaminolyticus]